MDGTGTGTGTAKPMEEVKGITGLGFSALLLLLSVFAMPPLFSAFPSVPASKVVGAMIKDMDEVLSKSYDYIIVGGGTSGCPLAATLSQKYSVLLVERGGSPYGNPLIEDRLLYDFANIRTDEFSSVSQAFRGDGGRYNARGRVLGGTTAINGGFYSRASEDDIKRAGWDAELVRESFEWVEEKIIFPNPITAWQSTLVRGILQAGIRPLNDFSLEHIKGTKVGAGIFDTHLKRRTSADLLAAGNPKNLDILLQATIQKVILDDEGVGKRPKARGIRFIRSSNDTVLSNKFYEVYLNDPKVHPSSGDVILSAGTLGSPQILMLSGIGPQQHLLQFGISPVIDAKEVGQSVQDNPTLAPALNYSSNALLRLHPDPPQIAGIEEKFQFVVETAVSNRGPRGSIQVPVLAKMTHPVSRGWIKLQSTDPRKNPAVKFNYLAEEEDMKTCLRMVKMLDRVARSRPVEAFLEKKQSVVPRNATEQELRDFCEEKVVTIYHYHGGCNIGSVVDEEHRVYGVDGLRVVDFSTFLESPGTNPMASLLMLGRYQGVRILREREREMMKNVTISDH
ncbi:hypothetical protein ACLOJK_029134 [Asimina triloba]